MNNVEISKCIRDAWAGCKPPRLQAIAYDNSGDNLECTAVSGFFAGKRWEDVTWPVLDTYAGDCSACLHFMSPEAYRYYLPAYMLIAVENYEQADVSANSAWCSLEPRERDEWKARVSGFTQAQRVAILAFLEYMQNVHGNDYPYGERPAVLLYWKSAL